MFPPRMGSVMNKEGHLELHPPPRPMHHHNQQQGHMAEGTCWSLALSFDTLVAESQT